MDALLSFRNFTVSLGKETQKQMPRILDMSEVRLEGSNPAPPPPAPQWKQQMARRTMLMGRLCSTVPASDHDADAGGKPTGAHSVVLSCFVLF